MCCFSTKIEKLALWRYYACNGSGCAIHFNDNFSKIENSGNPIGKSAVCSVVYGNERSLQIVNKFIDAASGINPSEDYDLIVLFISHLLSIMPMLKDKSFEEESEVRIYYYEGDLVKDSNGMPFYFDNKYREFIPIDGSSLPFVQQDCY